MNRVAIIGSGNAFFKDEGAGLYAAKFLKENYLFCDEVEIVDGGTLGFGLMPLLQEFDRVIIINTASNDGVTPGTVSVRDTDTFLEESLIKKTANEVEIAEMLQICSLSEKMAETTVVSIVPEDIISVEVGLTDTLICAWPGYMDAVMQQLVSAGLGWQEQEEGMNVEAIIDAFAYPSIEHGRGF